MEAGLGPSGLGGAGAPRLLRDRAAPRRRAQHGALGGQRGRRRGRRGGPERRPRRTHPAPLAADGRGEVSTLDLIGPGLTLLTGPDRGGWEAVARALACPAPVAVRSMDPISARALGIDGSGALLARPDGVPVALWPSPDRAPADAPVAAVA